MAKQPCVYILSNKRNGTLYIGVTSDIISRIGEHKRGIIEGFTQHYGLKDLVYYEIYQTMPETIIREKQLKKWRREWKLKLIEEKNPQWQGLYPGLWG